MSLTIKSPSDLSGLKATVMGLGLNGGGLATASYLASRGAIVTVTDMKTEEELRESVQALSGRNIRFVLGRHDMEDFSSADLVIKNPAVRPDSPFLKAAKAVETDISLFLRFSSSPIIAVTGSKGKSSTSSAIHHAFAVAGRRSFLGGNITVSPLDFLDQAGAGDPVVLELSSWQLADLRGKGLLRPAVAVLTSIMPDHMNRYRDMEEYVADKRLIYADQDASGWTVCNRDDPFGRSFAEETRARVLWYADRRLPPGSEGGWIQGGQGICAAFGAEEVLVPEETVVPGKHQKKNLLAAALAARAFGLGADAVRHAMGSFPGVEHRLEFFLERGGIKYYNDSAATIPQAVEAAVLSFSSPIVLITGGTDKALDFSGWKDFAMIPKRIVLLAGSGTDKLMGVLRESGREWEGPYDDLETAVRKAASLASAGDTVILSPGCTSFGMFQNEFDRGNRFKETVRALYSS